jgi:hypothetical protein
MSYLRQVSLALYEGMDHRKRPPKWVRFQVAQAILNGLALHEDLTNT